MKNHEKSSLNPNKRLKQHILIIDEKKRMILRNFLFEIQLIENESKKNYQKKIIEKREHMETIKRNKKIFIKTSSYFENIDETIFKDVSFL